MFHPLMPNLSSKTTDEIVKEMNDLFAKLKMFGRHNEMSTQLNMMLSAYREEYQKRLAEDYQKTKTKEQKTRKTDD